MISEFWLTSVAAFGSVDQPTPDPHAIYSALSTPSPITPIGNLLASFNFQDGNSSPATTEQDLHSDSGDSLHDILSTSITKALLNKYGTWTLTYLNLAENKEKNPELWSLLASGLRLAKTQPLIIPGWIGGSLSPSLIAEAWVGSQQAFGALWKSPLTFPATGFVLHPVLDTNAAVTPLKTAGSVSFSPKVHAHTLQRSVSSPRPSLYLTRTKKAPIKRKDAKKPYNLATFLNLTLRISVQCIMGYQTAESDLFGALHQIWEALLAVEPNKTYILLWYDPDQGSSRRLPSLRQGEQFPLQRNSIEFRYVAEWKLAWFSDLTTVRFRIGHDKPITSYLENSRVFNRVDDLEGLLPPRLCGSAA
jgi:hypothetical protein